MPCSSSNWFSVFMWGYGERQGNCRQSRLLINVSPQPGYGWTAHWWAVYNKASLNTRGDSGWGWSYIAIEKECIKKKWWYIFPARDAEEDERGTGKQNHLNRKQETEKNLPSCLSQPEDSDCETVLCDRREVTDRQHYISVCIYTSPRV